MNDNQIETYKQACELTTSIYISSLVAEFKKRTGKEIFLISISMIDVSEMQSAFNSKFIPGQCRIELANEKIEPKIPTVKIWTCCGGIDLDETEKCPVCGDGYE